MKYPDKAELEKKVWYRLLKVVYVACLIIAVFFSIFFSSLEAPRQIVKDVRLSCPDGQTFSLKENYIDFDSTGNPLLPSDQRETDRLCFTGKDIEIIDKTTNKTRLVQYEDLGLYGIYTLSNPNYQLEPIYKTEGSWLITIGLALGAIIVSTLMITLIKKVLLYILVGQKIF